MNKCLQHTKESMGLCIWCGKQLCENCIAHQECKKYYCEKCKTQLSPATNPKIPLIKTQQTLTNKTGDNKWT